MKTRFLSVRLPSLICGFGAAFLVLSFGCSKGDLTNEKAVGDMSKQLRDPSTFDPETHTDGELSDMINEFNSDYNGGSVSNLDAYQAMWLMEASINYLKCDIRTCEVLASEDYYIEVSTANDFTGDETEGYMDLLLAECDRIIADITADSDTFCLGLVDLELLDEQILMHMQVSRSYKANLGGRKWICSSATTYPWSSTVINGVITPDFSCTNAPQYGVNHLMSGRLTSWMRGYDCEVYEYDDPVPVPCDYNNAYIHSVGQFPVNASSTSWGTGCYSVTYPYLMPHSGRSNWTITAPCHNGAAIRCVTDERVFPWIVDYIQTNLPGYHPLYATAYRGVHSACCTTDHMKCTVSYGKCTYKTES